MKCTDQRRGPLGLGQPKVQHVPLVRPVLDILKIGLRLDDGDLLPGLAALLGLLPAGVWRLLAGWPGGAFLAFCLGGPSRLAGPGAFPTGIPTLRGRQDAVAVEIRLGELLQPLFQVFVILRSHLFAERTHRENGNRRDRRQAAQYPGAPLHE